MVASFRTQKRAPKGWLRFLWKTYWPPAWCSMGLHHRCPMYCPALHPMYPRWTPSGGGCESLSTGQHWPKPWPPNGSGPLTTSEWPCAPLALVNPPPHPRPPVGAGGPVPDSLSDHFPGWVISNPVPGNRYRLFPHIRPQWLLVHSPSEAPLGHQQPSGAPESGNRPKWPANRPMRAPLRLWDEGPRPIGRANTWGF